MFDLVEVGDDFVEQTETLDAVVVEFRVELEEIRDCRKHDADVVAVLVEQVLDTMSTCFRETKRELSR